MPCYRPLLAWKTAQGEVVFVERGHDVIAELSLPCGQCVGCRLERSRQWAMRCVHEAKMHEQNCFITLTYDDANCPHQLEYEHFQLFMRRLRKHFKNEGIRFFMCGEYGPQLQRPHFHACIFGLDFQDKYYWGTTGAKAKLYRSPTLEQLWPYGFSSIGEMNFASAAYTARYCMKKITGWNARYYYGGKTPEFTHMSLKPGIGKSFLAKWKTDIYPNDYVIINGVKTKPAKYYDKQLKKIDEASYEEIKYEREKLGREQYQDNTPQRLKDKETVAKAKIATLKRGMDK